MSSLTRWYGPTPSMPFPAEEMSKWSRIAALRSAVNGALEQARADKVIGKSLEAAVTPDCTAGGCLPGGDE